MTALLIAPMASSLIQPMASWLINTITGKGAKCRFLSLLAFPFLWKFWEEELQGLEMESEELEEDIING